MPLIVACSVDKQVRFVPPEDLFLHFSIAGAIILTFTRYSYVIYILGISLKKEYCITEYLRMSGVYWGLTVMDLMGKIDMMNKEEIVEFVKSCQHEDGGFGASVNHDSSLLYTLSAIQVNIIYRTLSFCIEAKLSCKSTFYHPPTLILFQILVIYNCLEVIDVENAIKYIASLQREDGSFAGDIWGV